MRSATLLLIATVVPCSVNAQAWTRDAGSAYVQFSHLYLRASSFYGPDGNTFGLLRGDYVQHVVGFYGEVGLVDRWLMMTLEGELFRRNILKNQGATAGFGDLRAGLWTGLVEKPFRLSAGVLVGLPTGDPTPTAGQGATPEEQAVARSLPTGDGEVDVHLRVAVGHSFGGGKWPLQHYVLGELGYAIRNDGLTDQIIYRTEFGTRVDRAGWDRLLLILRLSGTQLLGDPSLAGQTFSGLGEFAVLSPGAELAVRVWDRMHLSAGAAGALVAKNLPASPQFKFGISWEY